MSSQPRDVHRPWLEAPGKRLFAELVCLWLVFRPHEDNNDARKALTVLVVSVWAVLEVGSAFGYANLPDQFTFMRLFVGVLVGRMWGIEINNFAGVEFDYGAGSNDGVENGDE